MVTPYDFVLRVKKSLLSTKKVLCDSTSEDFSLELGEIVLQPQTQMFELCTK